MAEQIDNIIMNSSIYKMLVEELNCTDNYKKIGFQQSYYIKNVFCQIAKLGQNKVRFTSENYSFTIDYEPKEKAIICWFIDNLEAINRIIKTFKQKSDDQIIWENAEGKFIPPTKLQSLAQFNQERKKDYIERASIKNQYPNGIECPQCKSELCDSSPCITLPSYPPQKYIHCPKCGFRGYRIE